MNAETERTPGAEATRVQERVTDESIAPEEEPVNQAQEMLENLEVAVIRMTICERQMQALQDSRYSSVAAELNSLIDDAERLAKKVEAIVGGTPIREQRDIVARRPRPAPACTEEHPCDEPYCMACARKRRHPHPAAPRREEDE